MTGAKTSIQLQSSEKKLNASQIVGDLIDRFRRGAGWNLADEETLEQKRDRQQLILVFLEDLGAAKVPVKEYERLYRRAKVTRARRKSEGKDISYHITPEELVAEWFLLEKETAESLAKDKEYSSETCPEKGQHIGDDAIVEYCFGGTIDVILPCRVCRPHAFDQRREEFTEEHNRSFAARRLNAADEKDIEAVNNANQIPQYKNLKDPAEILRRAKTAVSAEMVSALGTSEYDELRGAWKVIVGALKYISEVE